MINTLATGVIIATGLFFLWLAAVSLFRSNVACGFLLGFATSPTKHYIELGIRLLVGAALIVRAPNLPQSVVFYFFGCGLIVTTVGLLLIPWRWHYRFAQQAVPKALRHIKLLGLASLALGVLLLAAVSHAPAV